MLVFSSPAAGLSQLTDQAQLNDPHALDQSLSASTADESMQQEPQPAAQELESGAVAVHEEMVAEQTVTTVEETPRSTRKRRRTSSQLSTGANEEHALDPKKSAGAGRVAFIDSL